MSTHNVKRILDRISQLISQSRAGKPGAQKALYMEYKNLWYQLCLRYGQNKEEAKDMMQEGLIKVYDNLNQYDPSRSAFSTWSSKVIVNCALRYQKQQIQHNNWVDLNNVREITEENIEMTQPVSNEILVNKIQELPVGYRLVFNMSVIEGYSHKEIAQYLSIAEGTSKSQLYKAKKMLREKLVESMSKKIMYE